MPNNFRKIPDVNGFFYSKDGNNASAVAYDGTNLDVARNSPKNIIPSTNDGTLKQIIGAGHYYLDGTTHGGGNYISDGLVVFESSANFFSNSIRDGAASTLYTGIIFKNIPAFVAVGGFNTIQSRLCFRKCKFLFCQNNRNAAGNGCIHLIDCVVIGGDSTHLFAIGKAGDTGGQVLEPEFRRNSINTTFYNIQTILLIGGPASQINIIDKNAFINPDGICCQIISTTYLSALTNCAFKGRIQILSTIYSSFSDPQLAVDYPDFVSNQGNFELTQDLDQCFNNAERQDLTLKMTSQLIKEGYNVGGEGFAFAKYIDVNPELSPPSMSINPATSAIGFKFREVKPGDNSVQITSDAILADPTEGNAVILNVLDLVTELNFDTTLNANQPRNKNVPSIENFLSGTAGGNPKRLTFEIRTSRNAPGDKPDNDSDWDNSFIGVAAGAWIKHEYASEKVTIDTLTRGKGDEDYDATLSQQEIVCIWFQIRITLRRDFDL